jgi:hypothetical protein
METSTGVHRVPSPLNGEKVAKGRMRGGNAQDSDSRERIPIPLPTSPPLTLTLSPLRGKVALVGTKLLIIPTTQKMRCAQRHHALLKRVHKSRTETDDENGHP